MATRERTRQQLTRTPPQQASWELAAERGPDWLFVRLEAGEAGPVEKEDLTEAIWEMIREHHASRVVLEFAEAEPIDEPLIEAIAEVGCRVRREGGLIRACGLSQNDCARLDKACDAGVPHFSTRSEAVGPRGWCSNPCE